MCDNFYNFYDISSSYFDNKHLVNLLNMDGLFDNMRVKWENVR